MTAAKLIAPAIETLFATGFDWFVTAAFFFASKDFNVSMVFLFISVKNLKIFCIDT